MCSLPILIAITLTRAAEVSVTYSIANAPIIVPIERIIEAFCLVLATPLGARSRALQRLISGVHVLCHGHLGVGAFEAGAIDACVNALMAKGTWL